MNRMRWFRLILVSFAILLVAVPALAAYAFGAWGPAASLESIPGTSSDLNTAALEGCPFLSSDGLKLYMASNRPGGYGGLDIWVAERASHGAPFGAPANLGEPINSAANDFCPSPMRDGQGFLFVSNRAGGCGLGDIYMTRYNPDTGWQTPENLGCEVNSAAEEAGPVIVYTEPGPPTLFFSSTRVGGPGGSDLYMSRMVGGWSFGNVELVPDVNSAANDQQPFVRRDGRELVFASDRAGGLGSFDIWSASRDSIVEPWLTPVNLGANVNSAAGETRPSLSWDGTMLLFGSNRAGVEGASDIFYSTREP